MSNGSLAIVSGERIYEPPSPPTNGKRCGFAILIILGIGGLALGGIGLGGILGRVGSITMSAVGGGGGIIILIIGIIGYVKNRPPQRDLLFEQHWARYSGPTREGFIEKTSQETHNRYGYEIKGETYFDAEKWRARIGQVADAPQMSQELLEFLETPCPFAQQEEIKVKDTHMVVYVPTQVAGRSLTLTNFIGLRSQFRKNINIPSFTWLDAGRNSIAARPLGQYDTPAIERPYWLVMTRHIIPNSKCHLFSEQQRMLPVGYEVPRTIEVTASAMAEWLHSAHRIFGGAGRCDASYIFTACEERIGEQQIIVGENVPDGIKLHLRNPEERSIELGSPGIAAARRFY